MKTFNIIYGLIDSRNDLIYYIGKSTVGSKRALSHLKESHSEKVNKWITNLSSKDVEIKISILEEVDELENLKIRESYWIQKFSIINPNLLNINLKSKINYEFYTEEEDLEFSNFSKNLSNISNFISKRRRALGISQEKLAINCGTSLSFISSIEQGKGNPSIKTLIKIFSFLEKQQPQHYVKINKRIK